MTSKNFSKTSCFGWHRDLKKSLSRLTVTFYLQILELLSTCIHQFNISTKRTQIETKIHKIIIFSFFCLFPNYYLLLWWSLFHFRCRSNLCKIWLRSSVLNNSAHQFCAKPPHAEYCKALFPWEIFRFLG